MQILKKYKKYLQGNSGHYSIALELFPSLREAVEVEKPEEEYYRVQLVPEDILAERVAALDAKETRVLAEIESIELSELQRLKAKYPGQ